MAPKKAALVDASNELVNAAVPDAPPAKAAGKQTVEQKYQKLTHLEHILKRPDTYVGSLEMVTTEMFVVDKESQRMDHRKITYVPGLYKIFDEIVVNAADNKQRDASMTEMRINIDRETNRISVYNNGKGIPVVIHQEHNVWVPELIFGHLLAGSNFDDDQKKTTGGRNGYGAKLCNIFSTEFCVETADSEVGKQYKQYFRDNMSKTEKAKISDYKKKEDWTRISWIPDLSKFGMENLDDDIVSLLERRAYDLAGCTHHTVKVYLNDKRISINNFSNYVDLFLGPKAGPTASPRVFEKVGDRWEVAIAPSDDGFQQFSFVNSIATTKGGTHVDHVANQVVEKLLEVMKKKHKGMEKMLKPAHIKSHIKVFVNCLIVNPTFDSQTKEFMQLKQSAFGSKCTFSDKFFKDVLGCGIMESIVEFAQTKANKELKKTDGAKKQRLTGISKLDDANEAGGKNGHKCTLLITEGDSAKALAVSGLSVIGRDHYGVFPLRGKLLNVRDANHSQVMNNKEISELKQIIGLQQGKDYSDPANRKALRYGHLMIMTDQDHDGSHIKGLIINFLHYNWPALLKTDFLREFVTPIVKVTRGRNSTPFFTLKEYMDWRENVGNAASSYAIKYYKGLGTSTSTEAKEYFSNLAQHELSFQWEGDGATALIERAFSKSMADARKDWLKAYDPQVFVDHSSATISYDDFINKELIHFSNADNVRSIPSMVDGLKPGQRKILFACFKRGKSLLKTEIKVAQLAGYVSEHSAYHHGETSLASTIVGMAQTFVGSNNIALLHPAGQFGTRLLGGKDAASPRYIFTKLPALTRLIFHPHDDAILDYLEDDGQSIEPKFYMPVVPLVLINGADGIGTGWSSSVPNYNPRDVVANMKRMMAGEEPQPMAPWYRGFTGSIVPADTKHSTFTAWGTVAKLDDTNVLISELPVRKWTQDYKDSVLEPMLTGTSGEKKVDVVLDDVREHHTDTKVSFTVRFSNAEGLSQAMATANLHKMLKLSSSLSTTNMTLFDDQGRIQRHENTESILTSFYDLRLKMYEKRKQHMTSVLTGEWSKLDNRVRFVLAVIAGDVKISNVKKDVIIAQLERDGFKTFEPVAKKKQADDDDDDGAAADAIDVDAKGKGMTAAAKSRGYDYLLGMPLWSLTMEKVTSLRAELAAKDAELQQLLGTDPKELWAADLDAFLAGYDAWEAELAAEEAGVPTKAGGKGKKAPPKKAAKHRGSDDDSDDDFDGESDEEWGAKKKKKAPPKAKAAAASKAPPPPDASTAVEIAPPDVPLAAPPKRKAAGNSSRPGSAASSQPEPVPVDSDDEDPFAGQSLAAILAARQGTKPAPVVKPAAVKARPASAASMDVDDDDEYQPGDSPAPRQPAKRMCDKPSPVAVAARPARKAKEQVTQVLDMSDDDDFDMSDDDDESPVKPPPKKPAAKPAAKPAPAAAKAKAKKALDSDEGSDDDEPPVKPPPKKAAAKPAAAKPPPKAKGKAKKASDSDEASDDDDDFDMSDDDDESPAKPPPKKAAAKPAATKPAAAKPAAAKAKAKKALDSDEGSDFDEPPAKPPPKKAAAKPAATKPPPKAKGKAKKASDSDEASDDDAASAVVQASRAATSRPGRNAQKVVYQDESSEEEESEVADDDSGSDYAD